MPRAVGENQPVIYNLETKYFREAHFCWHLKRVKGWSRDFYNREKVSPREWIKYSGSQKSIFISQESSFDSCLINSRVKTLNQENIWPETLKLPAVPSSKDDKDSEKGKRQKISFLMQTIVRFFVATNFPLKFEKYERCNKDRTNIRKKFETAAKYKSSTKF